MNTKRKQSHYEATWKQVSRTIIYNRTKLFRCKHLCYAISPERVEFSTYNNASQSQTGILNTKESIIQNGNYGYFFALRNSFFLISLTITSHSDRSLAQFWFRSSDGFLICCNMYEIKVQMNKRSCCLQFRLLSYIYGIKLDQG